MNDLITFTLGANEKQAALPKQCGLSLSLIPQISGIML